MRKFHLAAKLHIPFLFAVFYLPISGCELNKHSSKANSIHADSIWMIYTGNSNAVPYTVTIKFDSTKMNEEYRYQKVTQSSFPVVDIISEKAPPTTLAIAMDTRSLTNDLQSEAAAENGYKCGNLAITTYWNDGTVNRFKSSSNRIAQIIPPKQDSSGLITFFRLIDSFEIETPYRCM